MMAIRIAANREWRFETSKVVLMVVLAVGFVCEC